MAQQNVTLNKTYSTLIDEQEHLIKRSVRIRDNWFINGEVAPLCALLRGRGRIEKETNQKFEWLEQRIDKIQFKIQVPTTPADPATATELTVYTTEDVVSFLDTTSIIKDVETKEQMRVTKIDGKKITVIRGFGTTAKTAILGDITKPAEGNTPAVRGNTATFLNLSRAFPEGSYAPEGTILIKTDNNNYSQVFRDTVDITRNDMISPRYGDDGDLRKRRRTEVFKLHQRAIEHQLLFGEPKQDLSGTKPLYVTGGLLHFIQSNVETIDDASKFGPGSINDIMGLMADMGSDGDKVLMAGSGFLGKLDANAISVFGGAAGRSFKDYGVTINQITTRYGDLNIVYNPVLSAVQPNMGIFIDMSNIMLHIIKDTTLDTNIEISGYDGIIDTYLTDLGLEVSNEERHAILNLEF